LGEGGGGSIGVILGRWCGGKKQKENERRALVQGGWFLSNGMTGRKKTNEGTG